MITAVDTNVLLDLFAADPQFLNASRDALRSCIAAGRLIASDTVWAEIAAFFPSGPGAEHAMALVGIEFEPGSVASALTAGAAWADYRRRGGRRDRMVPDFLIGAHALHHADRLLTRDRGFYRSYFEGLEVFDPSAA